MDKTNKLDLTKSVILFIINTQFQALGMVSAPAHCAAAFGRSRTLHVPYQITFGVQGIHRQGPELFVELDLRPQPVLICAKRVKALVDLW